MKMTLNRDYVLRHKSGLSIRFEKDVPAHVPVRAVADAIALGAQNAETDETEIAKATQEISATRDAVVARAPAIEAAVRKMLARNQRGDFTAGGRPNRATLFRELGFEVSAEELEPIWANVAKDIE